MSAAANGQADAFYQALNRMIQQPANEHPTQIGGPEWIILALVTVLFVKVFAKLIWRFYDAIGRMSIQRRPPHDVKTREDLKKHEDYAYQQQQQQQQQQRAGSNPPDSQGRTWQNE